MDYWLIDKTFWVVEATVSQFVVFQLDQQPSAPIHQENRRVLTRAEQTNSRQG